jgi:uncharacterized protein (TIGR02594 family)
LRINIRNLICCVGPIIALSACSSPKEGIMPVHHFDIVNEAVQYIGLNEYTDRKELKELSGVDPVKTEWCAAFVNAVLEDSGVPSQRSLGHPAPLMARSYLTWGREVEFPLPGDIVIFPRGNVEWQGHVGFFIEERIINGVSYYMILGGNQNNEVSIVPYPSSKTISIRRHL